MKIFGEGKGKNKNMLAKRYEDDGKEFLKLNSVQKVAKAQFLNKFFGGGYTNWKKDCVTVVQISTIWS